MDCIVHGVKQSWTQLSDFHFTSSYYLAISLLDINSKGEKITILKRYLYPPIYYSITYNSQNMENTQVSTAKQVGKENVAYTHNGIFISHKKK